MNTKLSMVTGAPSRPAPPRPTSSRATAVASSACTRGSATSRSRSARPPYPTRTGPLPGAALTVVGPDRGTDTLLITVSGDAGHRRPSRNLNSGQFGVKVGRGIPRFQVYTNLHDSGSNHSLNGWVDDYTASFLRFS